MMLRRLGTGIGGVSANSKEGAASVTPAVVNTIRRENFGPVIAQLFLMGI
jgi:hypothetical protein